MKLRLLILLLILSSFPSSLSFALEDMPGSGVGNCIVDGSCSEFETLQSCPQDCIAVAVAEQSLQIERVYYILLGVLFLIFVFGILFFEYERFKHRKEQDLEVKSYIMGMLSRGYSKGAVKSELLKSGWNEAFLSRVFDSLSDYDLKIVKENDVMYHELQLKKYVFGLLNSGVPEKKIIIDLKKSGWSEGIIDKVMSELKIYFKQK